MKEKCAAILTVFKPSDMSLKGRQEISKWLRRASKTILNNADKLANRWTAR